MKKQLKAVSKFHKTFGQPVRKEFVNIPYEEYSLRYELMQEENNEYVDACVADDREAILDALTDKLYILCGTIVQHGAQEIIERAFNIVQNSNMSKLDNDGKPRINGENGVLDGSKPKGKILKSDNFFEPNFKHLL